MKWLISLLFSCAVQAEGIIFIGDSITARPGSAPKYFERHHKVLAQDGRTIRDFSLPRDLKTAAPYDTVVYYLGTNDMIAGYHQRNWQNVFIGHINTLQNRGFKVVVLVPPEYQWDVSDLPYIMWLTCMNEGYKCYPAPYDIQLTYDTVHPTPELHRQIAEFIKGVLQEHD